jgi:hypothetical protein
VINDGSISIVSSDDGINVRGGADGSSMMGRPGQNTFVGSSSNYLEINGGYVVVDADGDGIDSNGAITMTGGTVIVNGPTASMNGALDYMSSFKISGGLLVAAGSVGMAQAPSTSSTQNSVIVNLTTTASAGTLFHITTASGGDVLTFAPSKSWQSVVFSSPELESGESYLVHTGGASTGAVVDGLYTGGAYSGGTQVGDFVISSAVTTVGSAAGGRPGGGGMQPGGMRP